MLPLLPLLPLLPIVAGAVAPAPPTPPAERSVAAAVQVVRDLYAALARHDYARAYRLWDGGLSRAAYRRGYAHTVTTEVEPVPPFTAEGGAGSTYLDVRVSVSSLLDDGRRQLFGGTYTLRRVNDIDGSTAAQRRWHIVGARLRAIPAG